MTAIENLSAPANECELCRWRVESECRRFPPVLMQPPREVRYLSTVALGAPSELVEEQHAAKFGFPPATRKCGEFKAADEFAHMQNLPLGTLTCECRECIRFRARKAEEAKT